MESIMCVPTIIGKILLSFSLAYSWLSSWLQQLLQVIALNVMVINFNWSNLFKFALSQHFFFVIFALVCLAFHWSLISELILFKENSRRSNNTGWNGGNSKTWWRFIQFSEKVKILQLKCLNKDKQKVKDVQPKSFLPPSVVQCIFFHSFVCFMKVLVSFRLLLTLITQHHHYKFLFSFHNSCVRFGELRARFLVTARAEKKSLWRKSECVTFGKWKIVVKVKGRNIKNSSLN